MKPYGCAMLSVKNSEMKIKECVRYTRVAGSCRYLYHINVSLLSLYTFRPTVDSIKLMCNLYAFIFILCVTIDVVLRFPVSNFYDSSTYLLQYHCCHSTVHTLLLTHKDLSLRLLVGSSSILPPPPISRARR